MTRGLATSALSQLQSIMVERSLRRADVIDEQGVVPENLSVIKVGMAVGSRDLGDAIKTPVCLLGPGRLLGGSALFRLRSVLRIEAATPLRLCQIPISALYQLDLLDERFQMALYQAAGAYYENLADWAHVLRVGSIKPQLRRALVLISSEMGSLAFRMPSHVDLAHLLATRRETIAKYLGQLEAEGFLQKIDRWHGVIRSEACLQPRAA